MGCGIPERAEGVHVVIVNPETTRAVADGKVGEIWVNSPSKALGYWNNADVTQESFFASYYSDDSSEPSSEQFLRTGDLGFLHRGELFICGRLKDLIIVRGSNHYPQDIERTAERVTNEHIRKGCSAAFAVKHEATHTEAVVFMIEVGLYLDFCFNSFYSS